MDLSPRVKNTVKKSFYKKKGAPISVLFLVENIYNLYIFFQRIIFPGRRPGGGHIYNLYIFSNRHIYKLYIFLGRRRRPNSEEKEEKRRKRRGKGRRRRGGVREGQEGQGEEEGKGREEEKERKSTLSAMIYMQIKIIFGRHKSVGMKKIYNMYI